LYLEASGLGDRAHLENTCKPTRSCDPAEVDSAHIRVLAGDLALGAGALLLGGAALVYFMRGPAPSSGVHLRAVPVAGGAAAGLEGRF
jgi:hypothetical protein